MANKFNFGTKAETLQALVPYLVYSKIPTLFSFTSKEWRVSQGEIVEKIQVLFARKELIVRSSAKMEDGGLASMAGYFESIPHVFGSDTQQLVQAIIRVLKSYTKGDLKESEEDQVLVQIMVDDISMSGVLFTQDLNTGAPYYVINYDDETGFTDTITAGNGNSNRTLLVYRNAIKDLQSERFLSLLKAVKEIESVTGHDSLDIEFAVDTKHNVYILQVRQIVAARNWNRGVTVKINDAIKTLKSFVGESQKRLPGIYGSRSIFTTMSDWNPAEMIGASPRPLALSLYRYLITDFAWREARRQMGYHEPKGARLMVDLFGKPYIDVRNSFNSFLPDGLSASVADKLVEVWLNRLAEHKELHDKVEFDIVTTAVSFDFKERVNRQFPNILNNKEFGEYHDLLQSLTNNLIEGRVGAIDGELSKIEYLAKRNAELLAGKNPVTIQVVFALLEDCIKFGTIPFSILARHAFVATSFLRSLVEKKVLTEEGLSSFQSSIRTIATEFIEDVDAVNNKKIEVKELMKKYGHLRPGTYDILSKRYDQRDELLTGTFTLPKTEEKKDIFGLTKKQIDKIDVLIKEFNFNTTPEGLIEYIKKATAAREYAKFIFSKNISDSLEIIAAWGENNGLNREELSYLNIHDILNTVVCASGGTIEENLRELSETGRQKHEVTSALRLPYLIERVEDVSIVPLLVHKPNFITKKIVRGERVVVEGKSTDLPDLTGKIIVIESADPGFDWIFSRAIGGLVTKYGGANSHMAIRCAEFGLPAAIGCGEQIFDQLVQASAIELNCSEERIQPLKI